MKKLALAALIGFMPISAKAATIDYTGTTVDMFNQNYGDVAGVVDVSYEVSFDGGVTFNQGGRFWEGGYYGAAANNSSALIAQSSGASIMQITLQALGGNKFSSVGTNLAYWTENGPSVFGLTIKGIGDGLTIFSGSSAVTAGLNSISASGGAWTKIVLQLGNDWNVGYQTVEYEVSAVPIPAALPLLATGIAGIAALSRRKARKRNTV